MADGDILLDLNGDELLDTNGDGRTAGADVETCCWKQAYVCDGAATGLWERVANIPAATPVIEMAGTCYHFPDPSTPCPGPGRLDTGTWHADCAACAGVDCDNVEYAYEGRIVDLALCPCVPRGGGAYSFSLFDGGNWGVVLRRDVSVVGGVPTIAQTWGGVASAFGHSIVLSTQYRLHESQDGGVTPNPDCQGTGIGETDPDTPPNMIMQIEVYCEADPMAPSGVAWKWDIDLLQITMNGLRVDYGSGWVPVGGIGTAFWGGGGVALGPWNGADPADTDPNIVSAALYANEPACTNAGPPGDGGHFELRIFAPGV